MKAFLGFLQVLGGFFFLLNGLGGIIAGIWLALRGDWGSIGLGLVLVMVSQFILGIALLPSLAFGAGAVAVRRSRVGLLALGSLSVLYVAALVTVWSIGMLLLFMSRATDETWIPLLIWAYGAATGPWAYMAGQEARSGGGEGAMTTVMFAQIAYLVMVAVGLVGGASLLTMAQTFAGVMLISVLLQVGVVAMSLDEMQADF